MFDFPVVATPRGPAAATAPQRRDGVAVVLIREVDAEPATSDRGRLVAALLTLGIPLYPARPYDDTREVLPNGKEQRVTTWCLLDRSADGKHHTAKLVAAWDDPAWFTANPEHPFTYLKRGLENHRGLVRHVRRFVPLALRRRGRRVILIPMDASPAEKTKLLNLFEKTSA